MLTMKLARPAETQRMSHRGMCRTSRCGHIRVRTVQLPPTVVVTSSDFDTSQEQGIGERTFMDKQDEDCIG